MIFSSNMTEYSQIMSVIVRVITKSDERDTGVRFVYYEYESWQNWTTRSPVTNESTLWQNLRNKLAISDMFSWKKLQGTGQMHVTCTVQLHGHDADYTVQLQAWRVSVQLVYKSERC